MGRVTAGLDENVTRKDRDEQQAARRRQKANGERYQDALAAVRAQNTGHEHPAVDLLFLVNAPYACGQPIDLDLAAKVVAACRAGCVSCQTTLIPLLEADRATIAVLAGSLYVLLPGGLGSLPPVAQAWQPLAMHARLSNDGWQALAALQAMNDTDVHDLLDNVLDHWAAGGADLRFLALALHDGEDDDEDDAGPSPEYALVPGLMQASRGPLPALFLDPKTSAAGVDDLRGRCGWQPWDMTVVPEVDPFWWLRMEIATRSISEIAHTDLEGWDDVTLWQSPEPVPVARDWWDLVDRVEQVLLCGPVTCAGYDNPAAALQAAARRGEVLATVARARFW
ncbi:hypothetical protein ABZ897_43245 [Nonomuraea sp. NPDC046802]|uniref:hypothetical protein n=1 Tax=Nonomuraea sp. NPDC046802 TaxID=3154919 RepID=UPI0033D96E42